MNNINLTYNDVAIYLIVANTVVGLLFGLFPLFAGIRLNNRKYGMIGLVCATLGGALLGFFLSFPLAMIFNWMILRGAIAPAKEDTTTDPVDQAAA